MDEGDVERIMRHPQTMIASDGRLSQPGVEMPHPRAYGTFPRVLGVYVREKKVLSLETAIHKMTQMPARRLGLHDRGVLESGFVADLVVFDPATVGDRATFSDPSNIRSEFPTSSSTVAWRLRMAGRQRFAPAGCFDGWTPADPLVGRIARWVDADCTRRVLGAGLIRRGGVCGVRLGGDGREGMALLRTQGLSTHFPLMKIGFLGGSFDPVHFGHLIAAQDVLEQFQLDRLFLVPAAQAPMKPKDVQSSTEARLTMLNAATEWDGRMEVSDYELKKGGISYTIDSVRHFKSLFPNDELYWIIGGDQLPLLHKWKEIEELARLIDFIFMERPKHPTKPHVEIPGLRLHRCDGHLIEISSSELRARVPRGLSLHYFCPQKVIAYIESNHLYR